MTKQTKIVLAVVLSILVVVNGWYLTRDKSEVRTHGGETMGSTFSVTWVETAPHPELPREVDDILRQLTKLTST